MARFQETIKTLDSGKTKYKIIWISLPKKKKNIQFDSIHLHSMCHRQHLFYNQSLYIPFSHNHGHFSINQRSENSSNIIRNSLHSTVYSSIQHSNWKKKMNKKTGPAQEPYIYAASLNCKCFIMKEATLQAKSTNHRVMRFIIRVSCSSILPIWTRREPWTSIVPRSWETQPASVSESMKFLGLEFGWGC